MGGIQVPTVGISEFTFPESADLPLLKMERCLGEQSHLWT